VRRGEIWTVAGGPAYAGKPRPAVILQDDLFDATDSVTLCPITSDPSDLPLLRVAIEPSEGNGLRNRCRLMADKITTARRSRLGQRIGRLTDTEMAQLSRAVIVFLGMV
jgi:mRNA interferase MazF